MRSGSSGSIARSEAAEEAPVVAVERLAAQVLDHAALERRIATLQQQERVDEVGLERGEARRCARRDRRSRPISVVELAAAELGRAQPLELVGGDVDAAVGEPVGEVE